VEDAERLTSPPERGYCQVSHPYWLVSQSAQSSLFCFPFSIRNRYRYEYSTYPTPHERKTRLRISSPAAVLCLLLHLLLLLLCMSHIALLFAHISCSGTLSMLSHCLPLFAKLAPSHFVTSWETFRGTGSRMRHYCDRPGAAAATAESASG